MCRGNARVPLSLTRETLLQWSRTSEEAALIEVDLLALLGRFADAWNRHDLEALMSMMTDDGVFEASAVPQVNGQRSEGNRPAA